ncbi:MAG: sulfate adenylyltransferase [Deltaproteobacteria bacterium]|nr:sulfate adenylyltransferase [Deltaproteobacteria bacterium]
MRANGKEILCTLGPASLNEYVIQRLQELGVDLFRINLSHTRFADLPEIIKFVQSHSSVPICLDTEGAQIRTSYVPENELFLRENETISIKKSNYSGDSPHICFYPDYALDQLEIGDLLSIDFNSVVAQVTEQRDDDMSARILIGGAIGNNKAVTVFNKNIKMPPLTQKDCQALALGREMGIKHVALSFANCGDAVDEIRKHVASGTFVISKIESIKGLENLQDITEKSDALLIDRGDLSREIAIENIPYLQKYIISQASQNGKRVYVATNLLETMVKAPTPTRAEVNDIFSTLRDGADGLVLAAETAIGSYPVHCVMMINKMIRQFGKASSNIAVDEYRDSKSLLLVEAHGGILVNGFHENYEAAKRDNLKSIDVDITTLMSAEQIALGTYSPLDGFMTKNEVKSVLKDYRLPSGVVWPLPIVLQVRKEIAKRLKQGETVKLKLKNSEHVFALLHVQEIYSYDLGKMSQDAFGTNDDEHPGVALLKSRGEYFLGGQITLLKRLPSSLKHYELTPRQTRKLFSEKGWSKIVGFHTRNVIHRAHEHIQMLALNKFHCDGLFLHPVIGPKKNGDFSADIILKSYERMLAGNFYPAGRVLLGAFQNYSRYCGPREAVFTALCRKNFGCSHFIVGRDHTGVGNYYKPDEAQKLFESLGDIGIVPIFFKEQRYCELCADYVEECPHGEQHIVSISGTQAREKLSSAKNPPSWFMREEISQLIAQSICEGKEVFVK